MTAAAYAVLLPVALRAQETGALGSAFVCPCNNGQGKFIAIGLAQDRSKHGRHPHIRSNENMIGAEDMNKVSTAMRNNMTAYDKDKLEKATEADRVA